MSAPSRPPPHTPSRRALPSTPVLSSLTTVRNARDLAEAWPALAPGRVYRSACPAGAAEADVAALRGRLGVARLLDLRSDTERADDPRCLLLHASDAVTTSFTRDGMVDVDASGRWAAAAAAGPGPLPAAAPAPPAPGEPPLTITHVSLLDKARFYRALLASMPASAAARVALWRLISRRRSRAAAMTAINANGLPGLYRCMLDSSAPEFAAAARAVAAAVADRAPLLFFCRVGKDRTGLLAALLLALAGAPDAAIVDDYTRSAETNIAAVALGGLEKKDAELEGLNTAVFASAPAAAILAALDHVRSAHGGVSAYLASGGFGPREQAALVRGLVEERSAL